MPVTEITIEPLTMLLPDSIKSENEVKNKENERNSEESKQKLKESSDEAEEKSGDEDSNNDEQVQTRYGRIVRKPALYPEKEKYQKSLFKLVPLENMKKQCRIYIKWK